jgi:multidrug transporter EmrE-like cation transporter
MSNLSTNTLALLQPANIALILVAALGYSTATIGMKMGSSALTGIAIAIMVVGLAAAIFGEILVLKSSDLGPIYIAIIGIESLIVMLYAWYIGEAMSLRQIGGAGLVVFGLILVNS